jgi:adenosylcobinamide-phosphate synthase
MCSTLESAVILFCAVLLDAWVGEPPAMLHPVVWMGRAIAPLQRIAASSPARELAFGTLYSCGVVVGCGACAWFGLRLLVGQPWLRFAGQVYLLWSCFALRGLVQAGRDMQRAVAADDLSGARKALGSLCSRDPAHLDAAELIGATIESITENTSDSLVAPLFYFALLGVPGAVAYRAANTLDAMVGYHGRFEYLGKAAARFDDLLNLLPARLTTLVLWCSGALLRLSVCNGARVWWRDRYRTASPNAGHVMAMAAGLLDVRLDKRDAYVLGAELNAPDAGALLRALRLVSVSGWLFVMALTLGLGFAGMKHGYAR